MSSASKSKKSQEEGDEGSGLIAVCQMTSTSDIETNLETCKELIFRAKSRGAKVCIAINLSVTGRPRFELE